MPAHPSEESAPASLTDKVAQHSKESTASDHAIHNENKGPVEGTAGSLQSKGPQIPESEQELQVFPTQLLTHAVDMPDAKSKEELKAQAAEMNK